MIASSEFIRGYSEILVLSILCIRDSYVYDLVQTLNEITNGQIVITNPSMLFVVRKLQDEGKVTSYEKANDRGVFRKYYKITEYGLNYYYTFKQEYINSLESMKKIIVGNF